MSSRPLKGPQQVITNGAMSGNLTSIVSVIPNSSMVTYTCSWAGTTPVGAITIQVSDDYTQNGAGQAGNPGTWNTLTLSGTCPVSGATGTGAIDIVSTGFYAIRLVYTATSGTGTLQAYVTTCNQ